MEITLWLSPAQATQAASLAYTYSGLQSPGAGAATATSVIVTIPLDFVFLPGWQLFSQTSGILAGDQWSVPYIAYEQWLDLL